LRTKIDPKKLLSGPLIYLDGHFSGGKSYFSFGTKDSYQFTTGSSFDELQSWIDAQHWVFGYFGYDLKNKIEALSSGNKDLAGFPDALLFSPANLFEIERGRCRTLVGNYDLSCSEINRLLAHSQNGNNHGVELQPLITQDEYVRRVQGLKAHIQQGDIYEVNFCQAFEGKTTNFNPWDCFRKLNALTKAPFGAFMQWGPFSIISGSPERFMKRQGDRLVSQPMKGTAPRNADALQDERIKLNLQNDPKERSENVMITDLVRNDMSKHAKKGSVKVTELFGVHSFETVHQMISTVEADLQPNTSFTTLLQDLFPMGSMTGAPKIKAMQLIEDFEAFKRGPFSGAFGYIAPNGDFDFSVLIRSLFHNSDTGALVGCTGGAITIESDPQLEYLESMLKAKALFSALE
jgi:para-aminobenzoate synthetase component I